MLAAILFMIARPAHVSIPELMAHHFAPEVQTWLWLAFFASFAVKMPMWPVHTWLPDAHVEAPTAGSVILAGILLEDGRATASCASACRCSRTPRTISPRWIFALSGDRGDLHLAVAFRQTDVKKLIAYSSVAHMGLVTMGIFSGNAEGEQGRDLPDAEPRGDLRALFLIVGVIYDRMHTREIAAYGGLVNRMPWYAATFMLFTMGNVGLPGTSGFVGEILSVVGTYKASTWTALLATTGVILSAVYMLTLYRRVVFGTLENPKLAAISDMETREVAIFTPLIAATLYLGVQPNSVFSLTGASVDHLVQVYQMAIGG
jgi:NADH-quinone oxidoreductase subunit M